MNQIRNRVYNIPRAKAEKVLREAMDLAFSVKSDELDCSASCARRRTNKSHEEVLQMGLNEKVSLLSFIEKQESRFGGEDHFDIGLTTMRTSPTYFLWIKVSIKNGEELARKYKLKQTQ